MGLYSSPMKATAWILFICLSATCLATSVFVIHRHFRMKRLLSVALSPLSDDPTAAAAINQLARYTNSEATALLVKVAISDPRITDNRQVLAIGLIARRNDPEAFTALSNLLQPHINLGRREAVANALKDGICTALCIQSILHYEERLFFGVRDERNLIPDEPLDEPVKSIIERDHLRFVEDLNETLTRNSMLTLQVLRDVYGLGSDQPSPFALKTVETLQLRAACLPLAKSIRSLADPSEKNTLDTVFHGLACPASWLP